MALEKMLRVRLSDKEFEKLKVYAEGKGWSMALVIREYVKKLPKVPQQDSGTALEP